MTTATATLHLAIGQYLSVRCSDEDGVQQVQIDVDLQRARPAFRPYLQSEIQGEVALCQAWLHRALQQGGRALVRSDTPVLLLSGGLDPRTPPNLAREVVAGLKHGTLVEFPGLAHDVEGEDETQCTRSIVGQFLQQGVVADSSCAAQIRPAFKLLPESAAANSGKVARTDP